MDDTTKRISEKAVREFLADGKRHGLDFRTYEERDVALVGYISDIVR